MTDLHGFLADPTAHGRFDDGIGQVEFHLFAVGLPLFDTAKGGLGIGAHHGDLLRSGACSQRLGLGLGQARPSLSQAAFRQRHALLGLGESRCGRIHGRM